MLGHQRLHDSDHDAGFSKYEEVRIKEYASLREARAGLRSYLRLYNAERIHQSLDSHIPAEVYFVGSRKEITS